MGQYYKVANVGTFEYLHPHDFGDGLKLMEFGMSSAGTMMALASLIAMNGEQRGPWAGARIVISGDYADEGRFVPPAQSALNLYSFLDYDLEDEHIVRAKENELLTDMPVPQSITKTAQNWLASLGVGLTVGGRSVANRKPIPIKGLVDATKVYDQPEDLVEALGLTVEDSSASAVDGLAYLLRVNNQPSPLAWGSVVRSDIELDSLTGKAIYWKVSVIPQHKSCRVNRYLTFPATVAAVKAWLDVAG